MPLEVGLMVISGSLLFIFAPILIKAVFIRCAGYPSGKYGTSYGCCFRTVLWCTYCDRGMMQGVGKTVTPFIQCSGNVGVKFTGLLCLHPSSWFQTCICLRCIVGHNNTFILFTLHYFSGRWNPMNKTKVSFQYKNCKK